jgi:hypothetical protein
MNTAVSIDMFTTMRMALCACISMDGIYEEGGALPSFIIEGGHNPPDED